MAPYSDHQGYKLLLDSLLTIVAMEWTVEVYGVGSMTLEIAGTKSGEPDNSYYLQNASRVYGMKKIDLTVSPPPDLVVEIDLSSQRKNKLGLYAKLGVPEFWRIDHTGLHGYALALTDTYTPITESGAIGVLQLAWIDVFLQRRLEPRMLVLQAWQDFIRDRKSER